MMNRKPIFVVKAPEAFSDQVRDAVENQLHKVLGMEYHILMVFTREDNDFEFQQFDDSNIKPADLESLKEELKLKAKKANRAGEIGGFRL